MSKKNAVDTDPGTDQDAILHARGYISVQEIAQKTGYTAMTIHRWAEQKLFESVMLHKRWVKKDSFISYLGPAKAELFGFIEPEPSKKRKKD